MHENARKKEIPIKIMRTYNNMGARYRNKVVLTLLLLVDLQ